MSCADKPPVRTALEALIEHSAAFSGKDNERYAGTLALPFVHLWQDGEVLRYDDPGDVDLFEHYARATIDAENYGRPNCARRSLFWTGKISRRSA